ncbi:hypothetical protein L9F63_016226, partial [Diploptera punctata]
RLSFFTSFILRLISYILYKPQVLINKLVCQEVSSFFNTVTYICQMNLFTWSPSLRLMRVLFPGLFLEFCISYTLTNTHTWGCLLISLYFRFFSTNLLAVWILIIIKKSLYKLICHIVQCLFSVQKMIKFFYYYIFNFMVQMFLQNTG